MEDWVQDKIQQAREEGWTRLDLGNAGLETIPEAVFTLEWLEVLVCGSHKYNRQRDTWIPSENMGPGNRLTVIPAQIARLTHLRELHLDSNQISRLEPLTGLTNLTWLDLGENQIGELAPLAALTNLTWLDLGDNQIGELAPLAALANLTWLHFGGNQIRALEPLAGLTALTTLLLWHNQIRAIEPLAGLTALTALHLQNNQIRSFPRFVLALPRLSYLSCYGNPISDVPPVLLGPNLTANCLDAVRAHFADQAHGVVLDRAMKLILLGNGRVGKTSVLKRLVHDTFDAQEASTHGIQLLPWELDGADGPIRLNLWDFGGQDIYHGTHALFLRSQALFVLVWDRHSDGQAGYAEDGLFFAHFPLPYWLEYIRQASPDSPVIVVENKCDDGRSSGSPVPVPGPHLPFSAQEGHGREALLGAIRDACQRELAKVGARTIGVGRWQVKQTLLDYMAHDETRAADKRYRTISYAHFQEVCEARQGQVTSVPELLRYLHNTGVVYYQDGLFHNEIILDQRWAIEAIYSIFHREKAYRQLRARQGHFQRIDLQDLVWEERFSVDEQRLLLSFMESCALCFCLSDERDDDAIYIAPELLPDADTVRVDLDRRRRAGGQDAVYYTYTHPFLHQGVMRRFMVQLGRRFRDTALYWKDGVAIEPPRLQAMALVQCTRGVAGNPAWGCITLEVRGPQRQQVLNRLRTTFEQLAPAHREMAQAVSLDGQVWVNVADMEHARLQGTVVTQHGTVLEAQPWLFLLARKPHEDWGDDAPYPPEEAPMSSAPATVYLSYAWGDANETATSREDIVNQLYDALRADGYSVKRDKMDLGYKGLISAFMQEIGRGDCIVVVISDKYLTSPFCMFELLEIYRHQEFHDRICPIVLADARLRTLADRWTYVAHWKTELDRIEQLFQQVGINVISASGSFQEYEKYRDITHNADKLLTYLADINSQTPQMLAANDFATLKRAIDARLRQVAPRV